MKLSLKAIIAPEKITHYLLKRQFKNDKSRFLRKAGYTAEKWENLNVTYGNKF